MAVKLESQGQKRKGLVLNLTTQFEAASSKPSSPSSDPAGDVAKDEKLQNGVGEESAARKAELWDGENEKKNIENEAQGAKSRGDSDNLVWNSAEDKCASNGGCCPGETAPVPPVVGKNSNGN